MKRTDRCRLTLQVDTKDNKYRIQLSDLTVEDNQGVGNRPIEDYTKQPEKGINKRLLPAVDENIKLLLASFKNAMRSTSDSDF